MRQQQRWHPSQRRTPHQPMPLLLLLPLRPARFCRPSPSAAGSTWRGRCSLAELQAVLPRQLLRHSIASRSCFKDPIRPCDTSADRFSVASEPFTGQSHARTHITCSRQIRWIASRDWRDGMLGLELRQACDCSIEFDLMRVTVRDGLCARRLSSIARVQDQQRARHPRRVSRSSGHTHSHLSLCSTQLHGLRTVQAGQQQQQQTSAVDATARRRRMWRAVRRRQWGSEASSSRC